MILTQVDSQSHQPVLIKSLIEKIPLVTGVWVGCTFGGGGYSKALLEAGATKIIGIDRITFVGSLLKPIRKLIFPK